ncbi:MAG: hypothetical protein ABJA60_07130 [Nitrosospira sp.]
MKKVLIASLLAVCAPAAFAQTCTAPAGPANSGNVPFTTPAIDTCTAGDSTSFGSSICGGQVMQNQPVAIVQVDAGATNAFTVNVATTTAGFDPAVYLIGPGACGPATACADSNDANGPGATESLPSVGATLTVAAGTYYLAVGTTNSGPGIVGCGSVTITVNPTLPVELKNFSID